jgi:NHL repeat
LKGLTTPRGICFTPNGDVIISDFENHRLLLIDATLTKVIVQKIAAILNRLKRLVFLDRFWPQKAMKDPAFMNSVAHRAYAVMTTDASLWLIQKIKELSSSRPSWNIFGPSKSAHRPVP